MAKPEKILRFAEFSEWYDIVDDGMDEFTFDNTWPDGTPCVGITGRPRKPVEPRSTESSIISAIKAHYRAVRWMSGDVLPLNGYKMFTPRRIIYNGRRPQYEEYDDNDEDVEFHLDPLQELSDPKCEHYTERCLAHWTENEVYFVDDTFDDLTVLCVPIIDGLAVLGGDRWHGYHHVGVVPARPVACAAANKRYVKVECRDSHYE